MATDSESGMNGDGYERTNGGRFGAGNRGGPGRRRGPTPSTVTLERIKRAFAASWTDVDGPALLRKLAEESPRDYLQLMARLLPREVRQHTVQHRVLRMVVRPIDAKPVDRVPPVDIESAKANLAVGRNGRLLPVDTPTT